MNSKSELKRLVVSTLIRGNRLIKIINSQYLAEMLTNRMDPLTMESLMNKL